MAPFKIESAFYTLQLNTGNGKKVFGKQHQPWAILVFGRCSSMCLCWDLAFFLPYLVRAASCRSSFHPSSFSLLSFHGVFLQYSCCVGGQAIRLWFFQPWNYLESVHCIFLFFLPSHDLMLTCEFGLQIFFGTMRSTLTFNHAPYQVDFFWKCNGDASFSSGLLQKAPFGHPFLKITFTMIAQIHPWPLKMSLFRCDKTGITKP